MEAVVRAVEVLAAEVLALTELLLPVDVEVRAELARKLLVVVVVVVVVVGTAQLLIVFCGEGVSCPWNRYCGWTPLIRP